MELLKLLSAPELIAQIISFLILFFILRAFAWKKFLNILDQRKERIAAEFNKIESAKAQLEKLKQEYEGKLARIEEEARQKIQEAETRADQLSREIKDEARNQAKALLERNKEDIQIELSQARQQLKNDIVDLTLKATENLIMEKLTAQSDRKLVEDFLKQLEEGEKA